MNESNANRKEQSRRDFFCTTAATAAAAAAVFQPKCNIAMAVRVQAPLSMGILSHRESKVIKFDKQKMAIMM